MKYILFLLVFASLQGCINGGGWNKEKENRKKRVLVVHSFHDEDVWSQEVNFGIDHVFQDKDLEVKTVYMDTKRNNGIKYKIGAGEEVLMAMKEFEPDVLLTVGDNAQMYFARGLRKSKKVDIVFCGVKGRLSSYGFPTRNTTGVIMRPNIYRGIQLMRKLFKGAKSISILTDDSDYSTAFLEQVGDMRATLGLSLVKIIQTNNLLEWERAVKYPESDILAIYSFDTLMDENLQYVEKSEIINWTTQIAKVPVLSFTHYAVSGGALIAVVEKGDEQGELAARKVLKLFKGMKPTDVLIEVSPDSKVYINKSTADFHLYDVGVLDTEHPEECRGGGLAYD